MTAFEQEMKLILRGVTLVTTQEELIKKLEKGKPLRVKLGVDPTTPELHLGHTVCLRKMRTFQELGHTGVLIIGDFTARVGDPSGRIEGRPMLSAETVTRHSETYKEQAFRILDPKKTEIRYNSEWLDPFITSGKLLEYLPSVTHAQLTEREDFKNRITEKKPITMLEILYPIFQGYDSVAVGSDVELGGTDQTFNLLFGRDMQKDFKQEPQITVTMPILVGLDGVRKMSKTYKNAIALKDPPEDMFAKVLSVSDETMYSWTELLTGLEVENLKKMHPMEAKKNLAAAIVTSFYGQEAAKEAQARFVKVHSEKEIPQDIPEFQLPKDKKLFLSQVLTLAGLAPSRKEAQRKITEGAVKLDGKTATKDEAVELSSPTVLQLGRRNFCKVIP